MERTQQKTLLLFLATLGATVGLSIVIAKSISKTTKESDAVGVADQEVNHDEGDEKSDRKKSQLYTKTGDSGTSSLYNGERRPKADIVFDILGHQDELNAVIGIAREHCQISGNGLDSMLCEISSRLFDLGAAVATPVGKSSDKKKQYTEFNKANTQALEKWIDEVDGTCPPIINFVIPSGGMSSLYLNLARTVCRRAERAAFPLVLSGGVDAEVGRYLNRLSDLLFAMGRAAALREGREELLWRKAVLPGQTSATLTSDYIVDKKETKPDTSADTELDTKAEINLDNKADIPTATVIPTTISFNSLECSESNSIKSLEGEGEDLLSILVKALPPHT